MKLCDKDPTLVDDILSSIGHMTANEMLKWLQSVLGDEAETFMLLMWRMLIFELEKVEKGLA